MAKAKCRIKSPTLGTFYFDAVFSEEHRSTVTVTQHPVQTGADVADHAYKDPEEVMLSIGVSDIAMDYTSKRSDGYSKKAIDTLQTIMDLREPVKLYTLLRTYKNMVITSISVPKDYKTQTSIMATVIFTKVRLVSVTLRNVSKTSSSKSKGGSGSKKKTKTEGTKKSTQTTTEKPKSVLYKTVKG